MQKQQRLRAAVAPRRRLQVELLEVRSVLAAMGADLGDVAVETAGENVPAPLTLNAALVAAGFRGNREAFGGLFPDPAFRQPTSGSGEIVSLQVFSQDRVELANRFPGTDVEPTFSWSRWSFSPLMNADLVAVPGQVDISLPTSPGWLTDPSSGDFSSPLTEVELNVVRRDFSRTTIANLSSWRLESIFDRSEEASPDPVGNSSEGDLVAQPSPTEPPSYSTDAKAPDLGRSLLELPQGTLSAARESLTTSLHHSHPTNGDNSSSLATLAARHSLQSVRPSEADDDSSEDLRSNDDEGEADESSNSFSGSSSRTQKHESSVNAFVPSGSLAQRLQLRFRNSGNTAHSGVSPLGEAEHDSSESNRSAPNNWSSLAKAVDAFDEGGLVELAQGLPANSAWTGLDAGPSMGVPANPTSTRIDLDAEVGFYQSVEVASSVLESSDFDPSQAAMTPIVLLVAFQLFDQRRKNLELDADSRRSSRSQ